MEWIILLPTLIMVESGIEACFAVIARRKGRVAPWSLSFEFDPPRFADARLNRIEHLLLVVVAPLGVATALTGLVWAIADVFSSVPVALIVAGFLLISLRGLFLAACLAFAELDEGSPPAGRVQTQMLGLPTALQIGAGITLVVSFILLAALIAQGRSLDD